MAHSFPTRRSSDLRGQWVGLWSARRGTYRVIYRLDQDRHRLQVVHIDHRANVYR